MSHPEHPDTQAHHHAVKAITRGSRQYADDMAMEAMWQALEEGMNNDAAGKIFNDVYKKCLNGTLDRSK